MLALPEHLTAPSGLPLHPALRVALSEGTAALNALVDLVGSDVYRVPLLDPEWALELAQSVGSLEDRARATSVPLTAPNSMHSYGLLAADLALDPLIAELLARVFVPLTSGLFPEVDATGLDHHHGFVVHYGEGWERDLSLHVDDSEVTVNICLGREFEGGDLLMSGRRCAAHVEDRDRPGERYPVAQEPGFAIIHAGMHRHEALPLTRGERLNLIVWCKSRAYRAQQGSGCPAWCGTQDTSRP
ncbi:MAG: hypothetical protein KDA24_09710 [Deltaproteobacteria bacterium]|nr:hypothetical protein [Deltaproteobacteria bacterium]